MSFDIEYAAAGSQFVPKLIGGVNKKPMTFGAIQVRSAAIKRAVARMTFRFFESFFIALFVDSAAPQVKAFG